MALLTRPFYAQDTVLVARALLGQRLVRLLGGVRLSGLIAETEAYTGPDDAASHAYRRTRRSEIMYGEAGYAYVYFIYGRNHCLNAVAKPEGQVGAVLIRSILLSEGIEQIRAHRGQMPDRHLADGPGKLCQALMIGRLHNGLDLTADGELFIEAGVAVPDECIRITSRIGVRGDETALNRPWRFLWQSS